MSEHLLLMEKIKLVIWSMSAGVIVSFFFASNFLESATNFNPGGSVLFISPLMCGLILGIATSEQDAIYTIHGTIIMTVVATLFVALTFFYPFIIGVVIDPTGLYSFVYIPQNMIVTVILVLPISLLGSILGRQFAENTLHSSINRREKAALRSETEEWYKMLEEKLEEKKAALEKLERERNQQLTDSEIEKGND